MHIRMPLLFYHTIVYQQEFPVIGSTVGDPLHQQQPELAAADVIARVERMRQFHDEYISSSPLISSTIG